MPPTQMMGGWSDTEPATPEVQELCDQVRESLEKEYRKFTLYIATEYRQQITAGMNYLVKIKVDGEYVDVQISKALPVDGGDVTLSGFSPHHTADDPLVPFKGQPKKSKGCMIL